MFTTAQLAKFTLDEALLRRDQGLITQEQYRAFLYVWHADPTKPESAPMRHRPTGVDALVDELLTATGIDEFAKHEIWTDEVRAEFVKEQQAEFARQSFHR